jgi:hypothetical protein
VPSRRIVMGDRIVVQELGTELGPELRSERKGPERDVTVFPL